MDLKVTCISDSSSLVAEYGGLEVPERPVVAIPPIAPGLFKICCWKEPGGAPNGEGGTPPPNPVEAVAWAAGVPKMPEEGAPEEDMPAGWEPKDGGRNILPRMRAGGLLDF
jgi:hypothetical protein